MKPQYHAEDQKIIVRIPINLRRWGGKKVLVGPQGQDLRNLDLEHFTRKRIRKVANM